MSALGREEPFPDEIFYAIFEIGDRVEQQKYIEALRNTARKLKRITEFNHLFKEYQMDYLQRMKQKGNKTAFTDQPLELDCGDFVKLLMGRNGLQLQKVHLIEVGDQSPEAVEAYVHAAVAVMSKDKQMELASRLLAQLRKEEIL